MPIRLNLLAEAQALEDQRRRDPVKRVIFVGIVLVVGMLAWSSSLMFKTIVLKSDVARLQGELNSRTNDYRQVLENKRKLIENTQKLGAIQKLSTNRFLVGNFLNAFQQSTVDNVQLVHIKLDLNYVVTEEPKAVKGEGKAEAKPATPPKPATSTERISFALNAKDSSPVAGDAVNKFRESLSSADYFKEQLGSHDIRLKTLSAPQGQPGGRPFVLFALEASLPEKTR